MNSFDSLLPETFDAIKYSRHTITLRGVHVAKPFGPFKIGDFIPEVVYNFPCTTMCKIHDRIYPHLDLTYFAYEWFLTSFMGVQVQRRFLMFEEGMILFSMSIDNNTEPGYYSVAITPTSHSGTYIYPTLDPIDLFFDLYAHK